MSVHSSPLALTVLFMLMGGPLHPYEMQRRMKLWGKDQVVNLTQRATLYKTIDRLHDAGLIAVRQTERARRFPERTIYEATEAGSRVGREWLIEMLATSRNEYPRFPAALSFVMALTPAEALEVLERRAQVLSEQVTKLELVVAADGESPRPPWVTLLDADYLRATTAADLAWLRGVIDALHAGQLTWSREELAEAAKQFL